METTHFKKGLPLFTHYFAIKNYQQFSTTCSFLLLNLWIKTDWLNWILKLRFSLGRKYFPRQLRPNWSNQHHRQIKEQDITKLFLSENCFEQWLQEVTMALERWRWFLYHWEMHEEKNGVCNWNQIYVKFSNWNLTQLFYFCKIILTHF